ncbi:ankyrin repeat and SOCS box protein 3-like [Ruditapes philippinarum]|uniref:ankyrin repeat and SOCS box protein 3-like n=1 Tax=Ruditapes philippinarum TaxID=129788 RepID=UPI00295B89A3|nr:ankyrin repeat and SOCS box protein 3-like [Ruditapes philippinarum]
MNFQEAYPDTSSSVAAAALSGDNKLLKRLIRSGKAVDVKDNRGWQPVHEAAFHGNIACLKEILKCDVDVDSRTFEEQTALMLACKKGHSDCVSCLLKSGADPNSTTNEEYSPLWEASVNGSLECMKLLLGAGANVNGKIYTLDTALHAVIHHHDDSNSLLLVKCLVEAGINLTLQDESGLTAVFTAAQFGRTKCLQYILTCAHDRGNVFKKELVNKAAFDLATPLYLATQNDNVDCVRILLQNGADADLGISAEDIKPGFLYTPLLLALYRGNKECVEILTPATDLTNFIWEMNDFDPEIRVNFNPVAIAASLDSEECLRILLGNPFFSNLYSGEKNLNYLAERNPFSFDIRTRPAVLLTKKFRPFLEECLRRDEFALRKCIGCVIENGYKYFPVFILMLRLGVNVHFPRYWLDHVSMAPCALGYFCAMLKYTVKGNSSRGIIDTHK